MAGSLYQALDTTSNEIRVLRLHSDADEAPLRVDMITIPRTETALYDALSYTWGDAKSNETIKVNDTDMEIRGNLAKALRHFRRHGVASERPIWIDALCINQQDVPERNSQVAGMRELYVQAHTVHIWLGSVEKRGMLALEDMHNADGLEVWPSPEKIELLQDLDELTRDSYWQRAWVVQEAASALRVVMHGAGMMLPLAGKRPSRRGGSNELSKLFDKIAERSPLGADLAKRLAIFQRATLTQWIRIPGSLREPQFLHLYLDLMLKFRAREASNPRDKIYGILGLLPPDLGVSVDYDASVEDVYRGFAVCMIEACGTLEVLNTACSGSPSWVPDYRRPPPHYSVFIELLRGCGAAAMMGLECTFGSELKTKGFALGKVERTKTGDVAGGFRLCAEWPDLVRQCNTSLKICHLALKVMLACEAGGEAADISSYVEQARYADELKRYLSEFVVFEVGEWVGLAKGVQVGDALILPAGALNPFVARGESKYELVTPCYVERRGAALPISANDGLMGGGYVEKWKAGENVGLTLEELVIV